MPDTEDNQPPDADDKADLALIRQQQKELAARNAEQARLKAEAEKAKRNK